MHEKNKQQPSNAALREEAVLAFWKERDIFKKSLLKDAPNGDFVFYEGPPGANGIPMLHHFEARAFKDVIPRYKTMQGYHVDRRAGWDCHGLPVELQVEKELGLKSKREIETYGIALYNEKCKQAVLRYTHEWEVFTDRIGYWVDNARAYYTMENSFIESGWDIISEAEKRGYLYKDYKILPWCSRCGTALSSHELGQPGAYQDDKDLSVTAKFKIKGVENGYFLAWTTTPWTLPGNVALAVGADIEYVEAKVGNDIVVLAKDRLSILTEPYEVIATHKGSEMVGMEYEPLYPYFATLLPPSEQEKRACAYKIYAANFVTTTDGTGIVHTAVMYGQDDFELGSTIGLPKFHTVDLEGKFIKGMDFLEGRFVKDEDVAVDIVKDLSSRGLLFKKEKYEHSYPHCWRCKTPLIYYARDSWYFAMSKLRNELVERNETINWEPSHIKEGRFGEWLREVKDWAISRERYWGTPLPVWESADNERIVVDSIATIKRYGKRSKNTYTVMRHGGAEHNALRIYTSDPERYGLTMEGEDQSRSAAKELKNKHITTVYCSPYLRTRETAHIVMKELGLPQEALSIDERIRELEFGDFSGKSIDEYWEYVGRQTKAFDQKIPGGESYQDAKNRFGEFLYDIDQKHLGEEILIITHGIGLEVIPAIIAGADKKHSMELFNAHLGNLPGTYVTEDEFVPLPHNRDFELDLHRPYIDEIVLVKDGKEFHRVKEVMDVWFDSGAMPFAQDHYPFENKEWVETKGYPADFISEAIDQTRGWFYTLLAVATLIDKPAPFKNVVCLGHLLDKDGKKMSKSVGNVIEPYSQIEKFGADTVRLWMYSVTLPGDSKNYDEKTVLELSRQVFGLLYNLLSFYELYRDTNIESGERKIEKRNILDQWIMTRLHQLAGETTSYLDQYKLMEPVRAIRSFIDDLSTWYLRRSRDRIKDGAEDAKQTLYTVLQTLAQIMAPFAPFASEDIWQKLKSGNDPESVHLSRWPEPIPVNEELLQNMKTVRDICTEGNALRKKAGIAVRQPLQRFLVTGLTLPDEYLTLVKEELNVKEVIASDTTELDTAITPELKAEGNYRELVRAVQDVRKEKGLTPHDAIAITISKDAEQFLTPFLDSFKKTVVASAVHFSDNDGHEIKIDAKVYQIEMST